MRNPTKILTKQLKHWRHLWPVALAIGWLVMVWIPDTKQHWVHPEYASSFLNAHQKPWSMFNFMGHDNRDRCRFLSYALTDLNIELRAFLGSWGIAHPSLSIAWIFVLILTPWLFFKFAKRLLLTDDAASWATALYMVSSGVVSGVTLLFHPGKPVSQWLILLSAFLCLDLAQRWQWTRAWLVWTCMVACCFLDESGAFVFLVVPLLLRGKKLWFWWSGGLAYIALVTWVFPVVTEWAGHGRVDFWKYAGQGATTSALKLRTLGAYAETLAGSYLVPFEARRAPIGVLGLAAVVAMIIAGLWSQRKKAVVVTCASGLALFVMFHAVISNRENIFLGEARSSFYYGSVFPFFLVFLLVVDMMRVKQIALRNILGVSWMALFVWNTYAINAYWIKNHHWQWKQFFPQERGEPEHHIGFNVERKSWKH